MSERGGRFLNRWELCRKLTCPGPFLLFQHGGTGPTPQDHFHWAEALNAREWATVIWAVIAIVWMMTRKELRGSLLNVIRVVLSKTLVVPASMMLMYIVAVVFIASRIGLWEPRLVGATLAWIAVSALAGFFRVNEIPKDRHPLRSALRKSVAITVLVDAYVNLFVLPLILELVLLPLVALLGGLAATAEVSPELKGEEYDTTRSCLKSLMNTLGLALLIYATIRVVNELSSSSGLGHLGESLLLPLWLNLALMPFMYLLAIWVVYQTAFMMLDFSGNATEASVRRAKFALVRSVGPRPYVLGEFGPPWPYRLNRAETLAKARQVAADLRAERAVAQVSDAEVGR